MNLFLKKRYWEMIDTLNLLTTSQMAEFAAKGCLRFDGLIDDALNREFLDLFPVEIGSNDKHVNKLIPNCRPGELLPNVFPINHPISKIHSCFYIISI